MQAVVNQRGRPQGPHISLISCSFSGNLATNNCFKRPPRPSTGHGTPGSATTRDESPESTVHRHKALKQNGIHPGFETQGRPNQYFLTVLFDLKCQSDTNCNLNWIIDFGASQSITGWKEMMWFIDSDTRSHKTGIYNIGDTKRTKCNVLQCFKKSSRQQNELQSFILHSR